MARIAAQQHGVVTTAQLAMCGLDKDATAVRVLRGQLHPLHRGVYAVGHEALTLTARFGAAVLACGEGAVLSHCAAAAFLRLRDWDDRQPEVTVPRAGGRAIADIRVHQGALDRRDIWYRNNIAVTNPARTILDLAATMPPRALRRLVRQAQAEQRVNVRQLLDILERHGGRRGSVALRAVVADGPAPTRSELEDVVLDLIERAEIERPELNAALRIDERTIIPDMLWREHRVIVECDGARWHDGPLTKEDDVERQALLEADRYRLVRVNWRQAVDHPRRTAARIDAALQP